MPDVKKIRVEMYVPGQGSQAHEFEYCPIIFSSDTHEDTCPIGGGTCKYGLTIIEPPQTCPIKLHEIKMTFKIV